MEANGLPAAVLRVPGEISVGTRGTCLKQL